MFRTILTCTAAALLASSLSLVAATLSPVETGATFAPNAGTKGDRLDVAQRGGACPDAWPRFDIACFYDGLQPSSEVRKVPPVFTDRLMVAE